MPDHSKAVRETANELIALFDPGIFYRTTQEYYDQYASIDKAPDIQANKEQLINLQNRVADLITPLERRKLLEECKEELLDAVELLDQEGYEINADSLLARLTAILEDV